jgi:hypothetical protein
MGQGVGNLMQNRVPYVIEAIHLRQWRGNRDPLLRAVAAAKAPPRLPKDQRPALQAMLIHQRAGEPSGVLNVHALSPPSA